MNIEVTAVTPSDPPRRDYKDVLTVSLLVSGFLASWVYVFIHPSPEAFAACVGGQGVFASIFHAISVRDDKVPDAT